MTVDQVQHRLGGRVGVRRIDERRKPGGPEARGDLVTAQSCDSATRS
jgi:hypothetical protein